MPVTYRNRKRYLYYLRRKAAKNGKQRYFFSRKPIGDPVEEIPAGFEIVESVNAVVSLRKIAAPVIPAAEIGKVESVLKLYRHLEYYKAEARKRDIVVYERLGALSRAFLSGLSGRPHGPVSELESRPLDPGKNARYEPVMRFRLVDAKARTYTVERMCYRSSVDGWLSLHDLGPLSALAKRYLPHLGRESFFELC
ncbi:MAG: hypothetical protein ABII00_17695 [Elusimicrobiota bacterium]